MKRSEMLITIECVLYLYPGNADSVPDEARAILDAIEEAGMNPPYDSTSDDEYPNYCWEPEDEA